VSTGPEAAGSRYGSDSVDWAVDRIWEVLGRMCGAKKLGDQGNHSFVSARWWFGMATEFNPGVKMPGAKAWRAPKWLAESRSLSATNQLFQKYLDLLSLTFFDVLDEEKERARVWVAKNSACRTAIGMGSATLVSWHPGAKDGPSKSSLHC